MDPLTAIGLSSNILQFFDFVVRLVSTSREVSETVQGATLENSDLETVSRSLISLNQQVFRSMVKPTNEDSLESTPSIVYDLKFLASTCNQITNELLTKLKAIKAGNEPGKWKSIVTAIKTMYAKDQIEALRKRVEMYRSTMQSALLISISGKIDLVSEAISKQSSSTSEVGCFQTKVLEQIRNLTLDRQPSRQSTLLESLSNMTQHQREEQIQLVILDHLRLQSQPDREQRIPIAHQETFRWILSNEHREEHKGKQWSDFVSWLQTDKDSLYWITGKAGSGKSTLMKYLVHEQRCASSLRMWSSNLPLIVTRFYCWNSGDETQRSQEGLLRSLLYDALTQRPTEVERVFPNRWQRFVLFGFDPRPWTRSELVEGFQNLLASAKNTFKLCLFVDGLDEFDGDLLELIELFREAISYPDVKACVASRPWVVFEEAFAHRPSLMLQDLTYPDIIRYVTARFKESRGFTALCRRESQYASTLVENIAKKSCGVFLWVTLVVKSLLGGLANYDRVSDLQRRLDEMPGDLENFYQGMFDSIDPFYASHAGQLFILAATADGELTTLGLSFADDEDKDLAITRPVSPLSLEEEVYRCEEARRRLNSRCKGFLEIPSLDYLPQQKNDDAAKPERLTVPKLSPIASGKVNQPHPQRLNSSPAGGLEMNLSRPSTASDRLDETYENLQHDHVQRGTTTPHSEPVPVPFRQIAYLHRTVRDFVNGPVMKARINGMAENFDPYLPLLKSSILMIKTWDCGRGSHNVWGRHVTQAMKYATIIDRTSNSPSDLIDEIGSSIYKLPTEQRSDWGPRIAESKHWSTVCFSKTANKHHDLYGFLYLAAQHMLPSYIVAKVRQGVGIFPDQKHRPLLDRIIIQHAEYPSFCEPTLIHTSSRPPSLELVFHALRSNDDPNYQSSGQTTWSHLLAKCVKVSLDSSSLHELKHWADVVELFIKFGANPYMNRDSQQGSCIREAFGERLRERSQGLEKLLATTKKQWSRSKKFIPGPTKSTLPNVDDMVSITLHNRLQAARMSYGSLADHYKPMVALEKKKHTFLFTHCHHRYGVTLPSYKPRKSDPCLSELYGFEPGGFEPDGLDPSIFGPRAHEGPTHEGPTHEGPTHESSRRPLSNRREESGEPIVPWQ